MSEAQRLAYLKALEIPVWGLRTDKWPEAQCELAPEVISEPVRLGVSAGSSGVLLVCDRQELPASALGSDLARVLAEPPVWAWPQVSPGGEELMDLVQAQLSTAVLIFGKDLAQRLLGSECPQQVGQARIRILPRLDQLSQRTGACREMWAALGEMALVRAR